MSNGSRLFVIRPVGGADAPLNGRATADPGLLRRGGGPGVAEGGESRLFCEAVEVFELVVERGAEGGGADDGALRRSRTPLRGSPRRRSSFKWSTEMSAAPGAGVIRMRCSFGS